MAKEMMIVFVYDSEACTAEADDPAEAVLYFHPGWVSDSQRHALAGQVVGTAHCVKSLFSQPLSITLQSGKFILREYGRYILAVGSDRNIPDWVLKNRTDLLTSMISVYHGDLAAVASGLPGRQQFADKLYQMFETYLPVLQYGCHIFQRVPMLALPRSATSVYLEAVQVLDDCVRIKGVLGGVILYNNKIVASQLPPGLTSYLTVVDPYRIKSPAEALPTSSPLPLGAQLLAVYVQKESYEELKKQAELLQAFSDDGEEVLARIKKNQEAELEKFPATGMKRDKSLLFTAVPEEDLNMISPPTQDERTSEEERIKPNIPDVVPFTNRPRQRPNKLSLSFKTQKSLDEETKENTEQVFTGQTSVCGTPMVEFKRLHGNMLSICQNPDTQNDKTEPDVLKNIENSAKMKALEHDKNDYKMLFNFNSLGDHYINKPEPIRKLASINDIQDTFKRISFRATAKFKLKRSKEAESPKRMSKSVSTMTINDPSFPVFRNDGVEISESLFKQYMEQHQANQEDMSKEENMFTFNMKLQEQEKFEGFDSEVQRSPQKTPKKIPKDLKTIDQSRRKSLSLPLKSLTESEQDSTSVKKKLTGVQLTPLMEKLSHLAFSDKSSGYSSRVMTPLELREFTPLAEKQNNFHERKPSKPTTTDSQSEAVPLDLLPTYSQEAVQCGLFVSGIQNMALMVLVEKGADDCINPLWEISLNALGPIEQKCMEPFTAEPDSSDYSYLVLDPDWGTVKKGGPWASLDIATMGLMHSEMFSEDKRLTQIVLRSATSVVCGTRSGTEVYYCESGTSGARAAGLPAPADLLPAAAARAASRMARDHATVLL